MEFIKPNINIDFVGKRKIAYSVSLALILLSIISLIYHGGPKYGIDFAAAQSFKSNFPLQLSSAILNPDWPASDWRIQQFRPLGIQKIMNT